jgi:AcrR family transcriptional regulator
MRRKITKQDILSTGMGLFHRLGYNGVSVGDITGKAGIPKGSFYNHFESKQQFLEQVLDTYALESLELVQKHLLDARIPPPLGSGQTVRLTSPELGRRNGQNEKEISESSGNRAPA